MSTKHDIVFCTCKKHAHIKVHITYSKIQYILNLHCYKQCSQTGSMDNTVVYFFSLLTNWDSMLVSFILLPESSVTILFKQNILLTEKLSDSTLTMGSHSCD